MFGSARAGSASLTVGGTTYDVIKSDYSSASVTRETLVGQGGVQGYKQMPRAPFISATIRDAQGMSVAAFNAMVSETVVLTLVSGKIIIGAGMWTVDAQEVDTTEATFDVKFEGIQGSVTEN